MGVKQKFNISLLYFIFHGYSGVSWGGGDGGRGRGGKNKNKKNKKEKNKTSMFYLQELFFCTGSPMSWMTWGRMQLHTLTAR
jgi:hypothetical protein